MNTGKIADTLGIIGFIGAVVAGLWGAAIASQLMIGFAFVYIFGYLILKVITLTKENKTLRQSITPKDSDIEVLKCFDDPTWISSERKNQVPISSEFLKYDRCTILFNVLLPLKGEGLRNAPHNKYLIAHRFGKAGDQDANVFGVKYSGRNTWEITFSNNKGENVKRYLRIADELENGWHQFVISWNRNKPEILFQIIGISNNSKWTDRLENYLNNWPEKFDQSAFVGCWSSQTPYADSYIETKIANFWICNDYLGINHPIVIDHRKLVG